jgi:hypothetical protein
MLRVISHIISPPFEWIGRLFDDVKTDSLAVPDDVESFMIVAVYVHRPPKSLWH